MENKMDFVDLNIILKSEYQTLIAVLDEEIQLYSEIRDLEQKKNTILKAGKLIDFSPLNEKANQMLQRTVVLEGRRLEIIKRIAKETGNSHINSFTELIRISPDYIKEILENRFASFMAKINEIKELNEVNSRLIIDTLSLIDYTLKTVCGDDDLEINYDKDGKENKGKSRPMLIDKMI